MNRSVCRVVGSKERLMVVVTLSVIEGRVAPVRTASRSPATVGDVEVVAVFSFMAAALF